MRRDNRCVHREPRVRVRVPGMTGVVTWRLRALQCGVAVFTVLLLASLLRLVL